MIINSRVIQKSKRRPKPSHSSFGALIAIPRLLHRRSIRLDCSFWWVEMLQNDIREEVCRSFMSLFQNVSVLRCQIIRFCGVTQIIFCSPVFSQQKGVYWKTTLNSCPLCSSLAMFVDSAPNRTDQVCCRETTCYFSTQGRKARFRTFTVFVWLFTHLHC